MTHFVFHKLLFFARSSRNYNEFVRDIKEQDWYEEDMTATGILYSIWLFSVDRSCNKLRELTGWSRARFCREYGLHVRTVENWESGKSHPTDSLLHLLAFAVMSDLHSVPKSNQIAERE